MNKTPELKPEESILLGTVYTHEDTGLVIGTNDGHTYHEGIGAPSFPNPKMAFFKGMFVVGVQHDAATQYYIKNPADILKLLDIVKQDSSEAFIAIASDVVKELMGDGFDD